MTHSVIFQAKFITGMEAWEAAPAHTEVGLGSSLPLICVPQSEGVPSSGFAKMCLTLSLSGASLSQAVLCLLVSSQRTRKEGGMNRVALLELSEDSRQEGLQTER